MLRVHSSLRSLLVTLRPRLGLTLPPIPVEPPIAPSALALARHFCTRGYEEIWLAEINTAESYALAGALSQVVPGVRIGMGVLPLLTRSAMIHALGALTLHELTGGRFALGVGISSENIVRDWAGQPFDRPLVRMREALGVLRSALAGEKVSFAGDTLSMKNFRLPVRAEGLPLFVGALNPQMLRLTGALADGVVLNMVPEHALGQVLREVQRGAIEANRDVQHLEVVSRLHVCIAPSLAVGRDVVRRTFGPYVATAGYNRFFRWIGMEEEAAAVQEAFARGDRNGVAKAMSDRLCDAIGVSGPEDHVLARVRDYAERGVDVCVINPIAATADEQKRIYERLAKVLDGLTVPALGVARGARA
jgi:probable F420-dependent oxidoreductase